MATVTYVKVKKQSPAAMYGVINYCKREDKVRDIQSGRRIVSGINCNGENAFREFMTTKAAYDKLEGTYYYHYVQSFSYKEGITHNKAHEIAREFAAEAWPGHEILVATHLDTRNPHSHFVINSVNLENGYKLRQDTHTLEHLREKSDRICMSHGYSIIKNPQKRTSYIPRGEYRAAQRGNSWKAVLMQNINQAIQRKHTETVTDVENVLKQDGKMRENFISEFSSEMRVNLEALEEATDVLKTHLLKFLAITIGATTFFSMLVSVLLQLWLR